MSRTQVWRITSSSICSILLLFILRENVAEPLGTDTVNYDQLYQFWMTYEVNGTYGGIIIGRGNRNTTRKPDTVPLCAPQITYELSWYWALTSVIRIQWLAPFTQVNQFKCNIIVFMHSSFYSQNLEVSYLFLLLYWQIKPAEKWRLIGKCSLENCYDFIFIVISLYTLHSNEKTRESSTSSSVKWESRCVVCTESLANWKITIWKNRKRKFKRFLLQKAS